MNQSAKTVLKEKLAASSPCRIKLLGDSITHGVGGTGFQQNGEKITAGFARNPDGFCWAKMFKEYMKEKYGCEVENNACTGTKIEFILTHFDELVAPEDDIVLCTIGTNNRHQPFSTGAKRAKEDYMAEFYANILKLYERFKAAGKTVIFMANIPASDRNEQDGGDFWRIFHMNDVRDMYRRASELCGFPLISMYDLFLGYCRENKVTVDSLLVDGLHPSDAGYRVMFDLLLAELEI